MPDYNETTTSEMAGDFQHTAAPATDTSAASFLKEVAQPTIAAVTAGGGFVPPVPGTAPAKEEPAQNVYTPPADAQPIFNKSDLPPAGSGDEAPKEKPVSDNFKNTVLEQLVKMESTITASIYGFATGNIDNTDQFKSSDQDIRDLIEALEPYKDSITDMVPKWLPALMVYGAIKAKQGRKCYMAYKGNKANKAAAADPETMEKVSRAYSATGTRSNFMLYADGFYKNDRQGNWIKRTEETNLHRREKPDIADLDKILAIKSNRNKELLKAAFGWKEQDFIKHGIED